MEGKADFASRCTGRRYNIFGDHHTRNWLYRHRIVLGSGTTCRRVRFVQSDICHDFRFLDADRYDYRRDACGRLHARDYGYKWNNQERRNSFARRWPKRQHNRDQLWLWIFWDWITSKWQRNAF